MFEGFIDERVPWDMTGSPSWATTAAATSHCASPWTTPIVAHVWREWADTVTGQAIDSGHHIAEENPVALSEARTGFLLGS